MFKAIYYCKTKIIVYKLKFKIRYWTFFKYDTRTNEKRKRKVKVKNEIKHLIKMKILSYPFPIVHKLFARCHHLQPYPPNILKVDKTIDSHLVRPIKAHKENFETII